VLAAVAVAAGEVAPAHNLLLVAPGIQAKALAAAAVQTLVVMMATVLAAVEAVLVVVANLLKVVQVVTVAQERIGHITSQLFLAVAVAVVVTTIWVVQVGLMVAVTAVTELIHLKLELLTQAVAVAAADTQIIGLVVTAVLALSSLLTTTLLKEVQEEL
jgi:hypothetical protein